MWTDNIKEWTKMSYNDCIRVAHVISALLNTACEHRSSASFID